MDAELFEHEHDRLTEEVEQLTRQIHNHVNKTQVTGQDSNAYAAQYNDMAAQYGFLEQQINEVEQALA